MSSSNSLKKKIKIGLAGCGCALIVVIIMAVVVLTGTIKGVYGWVVQTAQNMGVTIPTDLKLPTEIRLPPELGIPPISLPKLPVNPFTLSGKEQIALGREVALKQKLDKDSFTDTKITAIAEKLVKALPERYKGPKEVGGWEWRFKGLRSLAGDINAIALPGGKIYVYDGLIKMTKGNEHELAAVMAHEMAHVVEQHSAEQLRNEGLLKSATDLILQNSGGGQGSEGGEAGAAAPESVIGVLATNLGKKLTQMQLSQAAEYQADDVGFQLMASAGYDPKVGLGSLRKIAKLSGGKGSILSGVFSTHPPTDQRILKI